MRLHTGGRIRSLIKRKQKSCRRKVSKWGMHSQGQNSPAGTPLPKFHIPPWEVVSNSVPMIMGISWDKTSCSKPLAYAEQNPTLGYFSTDEQGGNFLKNFYAHAHSCLSLEASGALRTYLPDSFHSSLFLAEVTCWLWWVENPTQSGLCKKGNVLALITVQLDCRLQV